MEKRLVDFVFSELFPLFPSGDGGEETALSQIIIQTPLETNSKNKRGIDENQPRFLLPFFSYSLHPQQ